MMTSSSHAKITSPYCLIFLESFCASIGLVEIGDLKVILDLKNYLDVINLLT